MDLHYKLHRYHAGEREVQARCGVEEGRSLILEEITEPVVRPVLASLIQASDPFVRGALEGGFPKYFAGVGVLFENRRRNKLAGNITLAKLTESGQLELHCICNENLGNCPKYITVRQLAPSARPYGPSTTGSQMDAAALRLLGRASTMFLASAHIVQQEQSSLLGLNHRGGPPGFIRHYTDASGSHLVFPDFSGNLFYSSLGNIQSDGRAGLAVPDFESGDLLHITGRAHNLFDADAQALMPRTRLVTVIDVETVVHRPACIQLALQAPEQLSPYNPPLRLLAAELANFVESPGGRTATLVNIGKESSTMKTFTFALDGPAEVSQADIKVLPGGYAIFDLSGHLVRRYQHMSPGDPQAVNDDFMRTWTLSAISPDRRTVAITVKKKPGGRISQFLHSLPVTPLPPIAFALQGFGGDFILPSPPPAKMVWLAGGAGITPFLAFAQSLSAQSSGAQVLLLYSCRADEAAICTKIRPAGWTLEIRVFNSSEWRSTGLTVLPRRLQADDLSSLDPDAEVFFCGPASLRRFIATTLKYRKVHTESFEF